jgi:hypothetical protein
MKFLVVPRPLTSSSRPGNYSALTPRRGVRLSRDSSTITSSTPRLPRVCSTELLGGKCESEGVEGVLEETRGSPQGPDPCRGCPRCLGHE